VRIDRVPFELKCQPLPNPNDDGTFVLVIRPFCQRPKLFTSLEVNGKAQPHEGLTWTTTIPYADGPETPVEVVARDRAGNESRWAHPVPTRRRLRVAAVDMSRDLPKELKPYLHLVDLQRNLYAWEVPAKKEKLRVELVYVPAGDFTMGQNEAGTASPAHTHAMPHGFWIGRTPITWKQYRTYCAATGTALPLPPAYKVTDDLPVTMVSWEQAGAFCQTLSSAMRLPTEAEWEKAARGDDGRLYPWGNASPDALHTHAAGLEGWIDQAKPVGSWPAGASPYGALDMAGNVYSWCVDARTDNYAEWARNRASQDTIPQAGTLKAVRGSDWHTIPESVKSWRREFQNHDGPAGHVGFRVCLPDPRKPAKPGR
jgi:serine/threonine-protein kinase